MTFQPALAQPAPAMRTSTAAFATRAVHAGHDPARHNGSVTTPVYQASTFVRPHARPVETGWDYSRIANPTRAALQACLTSLEGGASAVAVASGMAAITTVMQALSRSGATSSSRTMCTAGSGTWCRRSTRGGGSSTPRQTCAISTRSRRRSGPACA